MTPIVSPVSPQARTVALVPPVQQGLLEFPVVLDRPDPVAPQVRLDPPVWVAQGVWQGPLGLEVYPAYRELAVRKQCADELLARLKSIVGNIQYRKFPCTHMCVCQICIV